MFVMFVEPTATVIVSVNVLSAQSTRPEHPMYVSTSATVAGANVAKSITEDVDA